VAFMTNLGPIGYREVWVMTPEGQQARKIFDNQGDENTDYYDGGEWSPDGQRLLYVQGHQTGTQRQWTVQAVT
jgi:Tol biopolymer transport system component